MRVSTKDNALADALSRQTSVCHESELNHSVYLQLCLRWETLVMDIFASPHNTKCSLFFTRTGRSMRSLEDAFTTWWDSHLLYLFPPLPLVLRTVLKIRRDHSNCILVAPWWPRQPWFPILLNMAADHYCLRLYNNLLTQTPARSFTQISNRFTTPCGRSLLHKPHNVSLPETINSGFIHL